MTENFLDKAYIERDAEGTRVLYDSWSASYEAEIAANGYATPARGAEALAQFVEDKSMPILDFGCGTGLVGQALKLAGFEIVDGIDLSADMLVQARSKNIYRNLTQIEAGAELSGEYALISAIGVIGAGAAHISTLDALLYGLPSEGKLVFSFNDHALVEPENIGRLNEWLDCGAARLLFSEHGEHLPGKDLMSTVYVVEKA